MLFYLAQEFLQYQTGFSVKYSPPRNLVVVLRNVKGVSVMLKFEITRVLGKISIIHMQQKTRERKRKRACICTLIHLTSFLLQELPSE